MLLHLNCFGCSNRISAGTIMNGTAIYRIIRKGITLRRIVLYFSCGMVETNAVLPSLHTDTHTHIHYNIVFESNAHVQCKYYRAA